MEEYKEYIVKEAHTNEYEIYIVCLSFESIANYLEDISQEDLIQNSKGKILIDQLLITGNGKNRFLLCEFDNGNIVVDSAENIEPDKTYREETIKLLNKNKDIVENSILTDVEKNNIYNNVIF